jgi:hypothetical protein
MLKSQIRVYQGFGSLSFLLDYAGFYTSLIHQRFGLLKKPSGCIKKEGFMQSFRSLKLPIGSMRRNYLLNNRAL